MKWGRDLFLRGGGGAVVRPVAGDVEAEGDWIAGAGKSGAEGDKQRGQRKAGPDSDGGAHVELPDAVTGVRGDPHTGWKARAPA